MDLERAANPVDELGLAAFARRLDGIMQARQPHAAVHQGTNRLEPVALQQRMPAAAVAVNHDGRRADEGIG